MRRVGHVVPRRIESKEILRRIVQSAATHHNILPNVTHGVRDGQDLQRAAAGKSTISNPSHRLRNGQSRQRSAAKISNLSHRLRDGQTRQRAAAKKRIISNLGTLSLRN